MPRAITDVKSGKVHWRGASPRRGFAKLWESNVKRVIMNGVFLQADKRPATLPQWTNGQ